ncbi:MAG: Peroxiredoxin bcp [Candidatus Woesebacteria bacterium GW2011_GWA1_39_21]|uniref:thioredoxin-dependent peroxiredoxin n=1 Tax=Candidatus Woesebacteria bacterium GW2011_GWA1_39_21 TaxID=1618550 RepID=A0A0G0QIM2_9BACT|nr:MAG: Peroxiredoxin bcp [Candidatus Woesebacteria bacterium GW2011_GWA1_39_21]
MRAEAFTLSDQEGRSHSLSDYEGKWVVLYFYPKDNTPGCTKEACGFRDFLSQFSKEDIVVLGVSKDSVSLHQKFSDKYKLNFPILSDPEHKIIQAYGAWGMKKFMGREFEGTIRKTILIDPKGNIAKIYEKVNPLIHAEQVLDDIKLLQKEK